MDTGCGEKRAVEEGRERAKSGYHAEITMNSWRWLGLARGDRGCVDGRWGNLVDDAWFPALRKVQSSASRTLGVQHGSHDATHFGVPLITTPDHAPSSSRQKLVMHIYMDEQAVGQYYLTQRSRSAAAGASSVAQEHRSYVLARRLGMTINAAKRQRRLLLRRRRRRTVGWFGSVAFFSRHIC
jgi:hypothetical protein